MKYQFIFTRFSEGIIPKFDGPINRAMKNSLLLKCQPCIRVEPESALSLESNEVIISYNNTFMFSKENVKRPDLYLASVRTV